VFLTFNQKAVDLKNQALLKALRNSPNRHLAFAAYRNEIISRGDKDAVIYDFEILEKLFQSPDSQLAFITQETRFLENYFVKMIMDRGMHRKHFLTFQKQPKMRAAYPTESDVLAEFGLAAIKVRNPLRNYFSKNLNGEVVRKKNGDAFKLHSLNLLEGYFNRTSIRHIIDIVRQQDTNKFKTQRRQLTFSQLGSNDSEDRRDPDETMACTADVRVRAFDAAKDIILKLEGMDPEVARFAAAIMSFDKIQEVREYLGMDEVKFMKLKKRALEVAQDIPNYLLAELKNSIERTGIDPLSFLAREQKEAAKLGKRKPKLELVPEEQTDLSDYEDFDSAVA
jgi:hypothetical protein